MSKPRDDLANIIIEARNRDAFWVADQIIEWFTTNLTQTPVGGSGDVPTAAITIFSIAEHFKRMVPR